MIGCISRTRHFGASWVLNVVSFTSHSLHIYIYLSSHINSSSAIIIEVTSRYQAKTLLSSTVKPHRSLTEVMSMLLSNLTIPNITATGQDATVVFSPYLQHVHALSTVAHSLQERRDDSCTQTVEVPVWYGLDYNTCSMQSMIVIGVSTLFVILIPVAVLWTRWKLTNPRRGGKRSISVQLEKNEGTKTKSKETSKSNSASKSTSIVSVGQPSTSSGRGGMLDRLLGRYQTHGSHTAGKLSHIMIEVSV